MNARRKKSVVCIGLISCNTVIAVLTYARLPIGFAVMPIIAATLSIIVATTELIDTKLKSKRRE